MKKPFAASAVLPFLLAGSLAGAAERPAVPGQEKSGKTEVLEAGATALQSDTPPDKLDIQLFGLHPMKAAPREQMGAFHYCRQLNEDFAQCALFDGSGDNARLNGIEYIISEKLFARLPPEEKQYWHPHNYEVLSGTLVAPGLPTKAEHELMRKKMNSYGKTWHTWNTGAPGRPGDELPLGKPQLAWSLNRDGEANPELLQAEQQRLDINLQEKRQDRADLVRMARPQEGADALKGQFGRPTQPIPGVVDKASAP